MTEPRAPYIIVERNEAGFAWLRLNRAEARNALNLTALDQLEAEFETLSRDDDVRVIVIGSTSSVFCSGADLKSIDPADVERDPVAIPRRVQQLVSLVMASQKPVIAAVNGIAVAGGLELAMACDIRVAARGARIGDGHLKAGVIPGAGGAAVLPRLIGAGRAKLLLFTGDLWSAERAFETGLVDLLVSDDDFVAEVEALAARIARYSPLGLAMTKALVDAVPVQSVAQALAAELEANRTYCLSDDFAEGIRAFAEKRPPRFGKGIGTGVDT